MPSMPSSLSLAQQRLQAATDAFLVALADNLPPLSLLPFFSNTNTVVLQHAESRNPNPQQSRFTGLNAVRSYFDLQTTHWKRSAVQIHSTPILDADKRRTVINASVTWMWRRSGRQWTEDFTWTLDFDEGYKIIGFIVETKSGPGTCLMTAKDVEVPCPSFQAYPETPFALKAKPHHPAVRILFSPHRPCIFLASSHPCIFSALHYPFFPYAPLN